MKYEIGLKSISSVIFSNRMNDALYKGVDFNKYEDNKNCEELKGVNIVYQFSCYEDRTLRTDKNFLYAESYYIAASSIKGALCLEEKYRNIKFKDIKVEKDSITLSALKKFQYLYQNEEYIAQKKEDKNAKPKAIKYTEYFPAIRVEMMKDKQCVKGEILSMGNKTIDFDSIVDKIDLKTRLKLSEYLKQIKIISNMDYFKELKKTDCENDSAISKLEEVEDKIKKLSERKDVKIAFVGGFKGIIGGLNKCDFKESKELRNGFYIDEGTMLPYGLVELNITQK
jgi:hypothetical protein